jgi:carbonyl reductase 1
LAETNEHLKIVDNIYNFGPYSLSKIAMIALTRVNQREFDADSRKDLIISACCPGYVKTDLTRNNGKLTTEQGIEC